MSGHPLDPGPCPTEAHPMLDAWARWAEKNLGPPYSSPDYIIEPLRMAFFAGWVANPAPEAVVKMLRSLANEVLDWNEVPARCRICRCEVGSEPAWCLRKQAENLPLPPIPQEHRNATKT